MFFMLGMAGKELKNILVKIEKVYYSIPEEKKQEFVKIVEKIALAYAEGQINKK